MRSDFKKNCSLYSSWNVFKICDVKSSFLECAFYEENIYCVVQIDYELIKKIYLKCFKIVLVVICMVAFLILLLFLNINKSTHYIQHLFYY